MSRFARRLCALVPGIVILAVAGAAFADSTITSSGPLTSILISSDLNCAVNHTGDTDGEWFGDTACGTFVAIGTTVYGPANVPAGGNVVDSPGYTPYTAVSQMQSGSGTSGSPFVVTTVVGLGSTGVTLTETDSYVTGQESYRTDIALHNGGNSALTAMVYRAGDCFLQDSDNGLGVIQGSAPICKAEATSADPNRIEGLFPLTAGNSYVEDEYNTVWADVATGQALPNTCRCADQIDNGVAIAWPASVATGGTQTFSSLTQFSPTGAVPLSFAKTADASSAAPGTTDGYTITVTNAGAAAQTLTSITDTLPSGFTYVSGSSTGATTADPAVSGSTLTWTGSFPVPAASGATPGMLTLHFTVAIDAGEADGTYRNSVTGSGNGVTVVPATDVAPVSVQAALPIAAFSFGELPVILGGLGLIVLLGFGVRRLVRR
jgi:uncharacterized repeat protein (TIGR01451 family)